MVLPYRTVFRRHGRRLSLHRDGSFIHQLPPSGAQGSDFEQALRLARHWRGAGAPLQQPLAAAGPVAADSCKLRNCLACPGDFSCRRREPCTCPTSRVFFCHSLGFWLICLGIFFYVGAESITSVWVVKFLLDEFQIPWSNFVLGGLWLNITLGRFILAKAHFPSLPTLVFLALWSTLCSFLAAFGSATVSVLSFLALGFGFSGIYSLLIDRGAALAGERAIGILGTAGVLGAASGSALAGFVAQSLDFPWGIALAGFNTLGVVLAVLGSEKLSRVERGENI